MEITKINNEDIYLIFALTVFILWTLASIASAINAARKKKRK